MTNDKTEMLRLIVKALQVKRNKFGKLDGDHSEAIKMHNLAKKLGYLDKLPHGGYDRIDQACMIIQAMLGDKPKSIMDK